MLLWRVFTFNLFLFWLILCLIPMKPRVTIDSDQHNFLQQFLPVVALILGALSIFLRRYVTAPPFLKGLLARCALEVGEASNETGGELSLRHQSFLRFYSRTLPALVVSLAMNEAIAIVGFIHAYLQGDPAVIAPYVVFAFALNMTCRPDVHKMQQRVSGLDTSTQD